MTLHAEVEATKSVTGQAVTTTLKDNGFWSVVLHDGSDNWLEDCFV
jgi:hypothetical protein